MTETTVKSSVDVFEKVAADWRESQMNRSSKEQKKNTESEGIKRSKELAEQRRRVHTVELDDDLDIDSETELPEEPEEPLMRS